ncbi:MAG: hypothetical protein LLG06_11610 [Desulfobacteraceae bacterium]|nr:hypothetical protein [Desulfobacteraceae bacterium]
MNCRGCNKDLVEGDEYKMVAEWPFCPSCFEDLMQGRVKRVEAQPQEPPQAAAPVEPAAEATVPCSVCKRPLGPDEGMKLGIWTFCPECFGELKSFSQAYTGGSEDEAEEESKEAEEAEGGIAGFTVGLAKYVTCSECGRRIPQGGSRSLEGGGPLCPDCYYKMSVLAEKGAKVEPSTASAGIGTLEDPAGRAAARVEQGRCSCCDRPLRPGFFEDVEGFTLCRPCLSTDPALAVKIARERHRKLLDSLREGLGSAG